MDRSPSRVSQNALTRLMTKPAHKPMRSKYESRKQTYTNIKDQKLLQKYTSKPATIE